VKILNEMEILYPDLNRLIVQYDTRLLDGKYMFEWQCPERDDHMLQRIVHDNQYLYINCRNTSKIYLYSFDGKLIGNLNYAANCMEIINDQMYLMDYKNFWIIDLKTNARIQEWNLPQEKDGCVGGWFLKVDQENYIYFSPCQCSNYLYFYNKNGKEIKKFGTKGSSSKPGEFDLPRGITVNNKYLYVCDYWNHRVQVLDKENGNFISLWKTGERVFSYPQPILLDDNMLYVGDQNGIQVFTKEEYKCVQLLGDHGCRKGEFNMTRSLCIVNGTLYIVDGQNVRIQAWN